MVKPKLPISLQVYRTRGPNDSDWPNLAHAVWSKSPLRRSRYSLLARGNPCKAGAATTQGACDRSGTPRSHDSCQKGPWLNHLNWGLQHRACVSRPSFRSLQSILFGCVGCRDFKYVCPHQSAPDHQFALFGSFW